MALTVMPASFCVGSDTGACSLVFVPARARVRRGVSVAIGGECGGLAAVFDLPLATLSPRLAFAAGMDAGSGVRVMATEIFSTRTCRDVAATFCDLVDAGVFALVFKPGVARVLRGVTTPICMLFISHLPGALKRSVGLCGFDVCAQRPIVRNAVRQDFHEPRLPSPRTAPSTRLGG